MTAVMIIASCTQLLLEGKKKSHFRRLKSELLWLLNFKTYSLDWVVAGEGDETPPGYAKCIKDLGACVQPGLWILQLVHLQKQSRVMWYPP